MVTVELDVNKNAIKCGVPGDSSCCPIAIAADKAGFKQIDVDGQFLSFGYGIPDEDFGAVYFDDVFEVELPQYAQEFIAQFDMTEDEDGELLMSAIKPFKLKLKIPNKVASTLKLKKKYIKAAA